MLRLEKVSRTREIYITVPQQASAFNRTFITALALALGLHLVALFIFHIAPFKIGHSDSTFAPIAVALDLGPSSAEQASLARADIDEEDQIPPHLLHPTSFRPEALPLPSLDHLSIAFEPSPWLPSPWLSPIREPAGYHLESLPIDKQTLPQETLTFHLSGELADQQILSSTILEDFKFRLLLGAGTSGNQIRKFFEFDLLADSKGDIFWFECIQGKGDNLEPIAEEAVQKIQFHPSGRILPGKISLAFSFTRLLHD